MTKLLLFFACFFEKTKSFSSDLHLSVLSENSISKVFDFEKNNYKFSENEKYFIFYLNTYDNEEKIFDFFSISFKIDDLSNQFKINLKKILEEKEKQNINNPEHIFNILKYFIEIWIKEHINPILDGDFLLEKKININNNENLKKIFYHISNKISINYLIQEDTFSYPASTDFFKSITTFFVDKNKKFANLNFNSYAIEFIMNCSSFINNQIFLIINNFYQRYIIQNIILGNHFYYIKESHFMNLLENQNINFSFLFFLFSLRIMSNMLNINFCIENNEKITNLHNYDFQRLKDLKFYIENNFNLNNFYSFFKKYYFNKSNLESYNLEENGRFCFFSFLSPSFILFSEIFKDIKTLNDNFYSILEGCKKGIIFYEKYMQIDEMKNIKKITEKNNVICFGENHILEINGLRINNKQEGITINDVILYKILSFFDIQYLDMNLNHNCDNSILLGILKQNNLKRIQLGHLNISHVNYFLNNLAQIKNINARNIYLIFADNNYYILYNIHILIKKIIYLLNIKENDEFFFEIKIVNSKHIKNINENLYKNILNEIPREKISNKNQKIINLKLTAIFDNSKNEENKIYTLKSGDFIINLKINS